MSTRPRASQLTGSSVEPPDGQQQTQRSSTRRGPAAILGVVIAVGAFLAALWVTLGAVFQTDRGLDLTDEGLYLLAADATTKSAAWGSPGFPWGWHTGPLFRLVGQDIAAFRTLSMTLLVLAAGSFGWWAVTAAQSLRLDSTGAVRSIRVVGAAVAGIGSLLLYENFLRTPGYNWVALLSIVITGSGYLMLVSKNRSDDPRSPLLVAGVVVASVGIVVGLPAKPSVPIVLWGLGLAATALLTGARRAAGWALAILGGSAVCIAVAIAVRLWPWDFVSVFARTWHAPKHHDTQSFGGAVGEVLNSPTILWEGLRLLPSYYWVVWIGAILAPVLARRWRPRERPREMVATAAVVGLTAAAVAVVVVPSLVGGGPSGLPSPVPLVGLLGSVAVGFVVIAVAVPPPADAPTEVGHRRRALVLVAYVGALPFVYSFGSSVGFIGQAAAAAGIFLVAAVAGFAALTVRPTVVVGPACVLVVALAVVTMAVAWGREHPYRGASLSQQTVTVERGTHRILVDSDQAAVLGSLRRQAVAAGWQEGTPVVGVAWRWTSTIPFVLGGQVPDSLMLTIFGGAGNQDRIAAYNMATAAGAIRGSDPWVVASPDESLTAEQRTDIASVVAILNRETGRQFPTDYTCVAAAGPIRLWKPVADPDRAPCPTPKPATSAHDLDVGWTAP